MEVDARASLIPSRVPGIATPILAKGERFITLDGLRGIAAIAVAVFHFDGALMPGGYLAVDFFFVLSGFVLIRTYEPRFKTGLGIVRFMLIRGVRLYPLYAVGIAIGTAFALQGVLRRSAYHMAESEFLGGLAFNILMLPSPFSRGLFPFNGPAWSLFFEVLANLALVGILTRMRTFALTILALTAGLVLTMAVHHFQHTAGGLRLLSEGEASTAAGAYWDGWYVGVLRTAFSFTTGVVIARLSTAIDRPTKRSAAFCFIVLLLLMFVAVPLENRIAYDLTFILIFSPILVVAGSRIEPHRLLVPAAALAGELSYALYAIHVPIAHACQFAARKAGLSNFAIAPVYLLVSLALGWLCVRWVDLPMRQMLRRKLIRPHAATPDPSIGL